MAHQFGKHYGYLALWENSISIGLWHISLADASKVFGTTEIWHIKGIWHYRNMAYQRGCSTSFWKYSGCLVPWKNHHDVKGVWQTSWMFGTTEKEKQKQNKKWPIDRAVAHRGVFYRGNTAYR